MIIFYGTGNCDTAPFANLAAMIWWYNMLWYGISSLWSLWRNLKTVLSGTWKSKQCGWFGWLGNYQLDDCQEVKKRKWRYLQQLGVTLDKKNNLTGAICPGSSDGISQKFTAILWGRQEVPRGHLDYNDDDGGWLVGMIICVEIIFFYFGGFDSDREIIRGRDKRLWFVIDVRKDQAGVNCFRSEPHKSTDRFVDTDLVFQQIYFIPMTCLIDPFVCFSH